MRPLNLHQGPPTNCLRAFLTWILNRHHDLGAATEIRALRREANLSFSLQGGDLTLVDDTYGRLVRASWTALGVDAAVDTLFAVNLDPVRPVERRERGSVHRSWQAHPMCQAPLTDTTYGVIVVT